MSKEKSQLENITPPVAGGSIDKKATVAALPVNFSLGKQLTADDKLASRSEVLKYFLPNYQAELDRVEQEEKEKKARMEREGMNYDLYLLIKEKLAPEFQEKLSKGIFKYDDLKKSSLFELVQKNPSLYNPSPKDIQFIANNLKEFFPKIKEDDYPHLGIFLNSFIHSYFNSVPEEERGDLKVTLNNTEKLDCVGAELSFGSLKVKEVRDAFGAKAHGSAILEAEKADKWTGRDTYGSAVIRIGKSGNSSGQRAHGNVHMYIKEAGGFLAYRAYGSAIFEVEKALDNAGHGVHDNVNMFIKEAGVETGSFMHGDATITITQRCRSISNSREDNAKIILPGGRVLMPGDSI